MWVTLTDYMQFQFVFVFFLLSLTVIFFLNTLTVWIWMNLFQRQLKVMSDEHFSTILARHAMWKIFF